MTLSGLYISKEILLDSGLAYRLFYALFADETLFLMPPLSSLQSLSPVPLPVTQMIALPSSTANFTDVELNRRIFKSRLLHQRGACSYIETITVSCHFFGSFRCPLLLSDAWSVIRFPNVFFNRKELKYVTAEKPKVSQNSNPQRIVASV